MSKIPMQTMYEVMKLAKVCQIPEEEVLLCLFAQDYELSYVSVCKANALLFGL